MKVQAAHRYRSRYSRVSMPWSGFLVPHLFAVHLNFFKRSKPDTTINPYPRFFGTITKRDFWKKNPESLLVTSQLGLKK